MFLFPHFFIGFFGLWCLYGISRLILKLQGKQMWTGVPKWDEEESRRRALQRSRREELPAKGPMFNEIDSLLHNFEAETHRKPVNIYLGQKQWDYLTDETARLQGRAKGEKIYITEIDDYKGCKLLKVDAPDHIGVT